MSVKQITTHQAKTHLSQLIREVQAGEKVVILNGKVPVAELTAAEGGLPSRPKVGTVTSRPVHYADDAFAPLTNDELKEWGL